MATQGPTPVDTGTTTIVVTGPAERSPAPVVPGPGTTGQIPTVATPQGPPESAPPSVAPGPGTGQSTSPSATATPAVIELPVEIPTPADQGNNVIPTVPNLIEVLADGTIIIQNASALNFTGSGVTATANGSVATLNITSGSTYANSNVVTLLSNFGSNTVVTTGNITGGYFIGNGSQLTGIAASYGNANVVANLAALGSNPVSTTGNVSAGYLFGNGSQLSGLPATYGNANVVANLAALGSNPVSTTGNVSAGYLFGNGSQLTGIAASGNTGNVTFSDQVVIGTGSNDGSGGLYLAPGNASIANSAVQYLRVRGGDVVTHIHLDTGNNQYYDQYFGDDGKYVKLANTGNVVIGSDDAVGNSAQWTFGTSGNLTLPRGGVVYETNIPDGGLNGNTIALKPSGGTNADQQLLIYPTTNDANHLHLTTGNLYSTELFLGDDNLYVKLANTGNIVVNSNDGTGNTAQWTFGTDGTLTAPGNISAVNLVINNIRSDDSSFVNIEDGVNITGAVVASGNVTSGNVNTGVITLTNGAVIKDTAGDAVAFGENAGLTSQGTYGVAVGTAAGQTSQGINSVAVGVSAGFSSQGAGAVAVGGVAGSVSQGAGAAAFGPYAGFTNQGANAVAVGQYAGYVSQGINAVAIGYFAGNNLQANNSIILNATGAVLDNTAANSLVIAPVRNDVANIGNVMFYNATSKEITYGNVISVAGNITGGNLAIGTVTATGNITFAGDSSSAPTLNNFNVNAVSITATAGNLAVINGGAGGLSGGYISATRDISATGNVIAGNVTTAGLISATGNITGGNILGGANVNATTHTGTTVSVSANVTGGNLLTGGLISATGNVSGNYFIGNGAALTGIAASVPSQTILPTVQTITAEARPAGLFGGGQGGANVTVANTISVTEYGVIITAGTISETYKTGALGSIPGTVSLTFTTGLNSTQYTLFAYVTSNAGTYYSNAVTGTSGICLLAGTQIALSDGTHKAIEHITYTDKLLSWDFDRGCYAETTAIWIKRGETGSQYNLLTFSDGTTLRTFDQHRIFNKQAGAFTYPMTSATPVGTITVNEHGQEIILTNKQVIQDTIEYYNVITDYHMNLFSDSVLTSCRFNNIYPITNMKFVKDGRTLRTRAEFENVPDRFFHGLRLAEQTTDVETVEWYVNRLLSTEVSTESELVV